MSSRCPGENPEVVHLPCFWDMVSRRPKKLLSVDYDGTLAPFRTERMEALPLDGILDLLTRIELRRDTTVAVISGRPLKELEKMLGSWRGTMIGSHGFERRSSSGHIKRQELLPRQKDGLDLAYELILHKGLARFSEIKPASVALHTRGIEQAKARALEEDTFLRWDGLSSRYSLETRRFNGGVEIRAKGYNKGDAVEDLLREEPQGTLCVYIGDDDTDEDVFERIRTSGVGIRVGDPSAQTAARGFLRDIPAVKGFLEIWSSLAEAE